MDAADFISAAWPSSSSGTAVALGTAVAVGGALLAAGAACRRRRSSSAGAAAQQEPRREVHPSTAPGRDAPLFAGIRVVELATVVRLHITRLVLCDRGADRSKHISVG